MQRGKIKPAKKAILLGMAQVGKTSLLNNLSEAQSLGDEELGAVLQYRIISDDEIQLQIWETPDKENYKTFLPSMVYVRTDIAFFILDGSCQQHSLEEQAAYLNEANEALQSVAPEAARVLIVNIKDAYRVTAQQVAALKADLLNSEPIGIGIENHFYISAKNDDPLKLKNFLLSQTKLSVQKKPAEFSPKKLQEPQQKTSLWGKFFGAVIGAVIGVVIGTMLGALGGPAAAAVALYSGVHGAIAGASLGGCFFCNVRCLVCKPAPEAWWFFAGGGKASLRSALAG